MDILTTLMNLFKALLVVWVLIGVLMIVSMWKIFVKAGKPGWASIIPIYNIIVLLQIVGKPWWWLLLMIIPIVNFIAAPVLGIWMINLLSKSFGQGVGFTLGLLFLAIIFYPLLAFGKYTYVGAAGK